MIIKTADDKQSDITVLGELQKRPDLTDAKRNALEKELKLLRAGMKGEAESAYLIDFDLKSSKMTAVIHDLRLDVKGRVAQVDHLLIHRTLTVFVLETKHFNSGMKITDDGEFLRWNDYKKTYEGMASPLAQNERHIDVLKDAFQTIEMPTRLGIRLSPTFESFVLVSQNARIDRSKKFDSSRIIKADVLLKAIEKQLDSDGIMGTLGSMGRFVATETIEDVARKLVVLHRPIAINYRAKFGITDGASTKTPNSPSVATPVRVPDPEPSSSVAPVQPLQSNDEPVCRACSSAKVTIQHGKFGYYFKCSDCGGNTPAKIGCGVAGHKERLRKDADCFYRECAECKTSSLFFKNAVAT
jgi:hypothetical protein